VSYPPFPERWAIDATPEHFEGKTKETFLAWLKALPSDTLFCQGRYRTCDCPIAEYVNARIGWSFVLDFPERDQPLPGPGE
jgi:hypothetical protein